MYPAGPEEDQRTYRPKRYGNNNKDEVNSPKTLNDKYHQALSQKFRQLINIPREWYETSYSLRIAINSSTTVLQDESVWYQNSFMFFFLLI